MIKESQVFNLLTNASRGSKLFKAPTVTRHNYTTVLIIVKDKVYHCMCFSFHTKTIDQPYIEHFVLLQKNLLNLMNFIDFYFLSILIVHKIVDSQQNYFCRGTYCNEYLVCYLIQMSPFKYLS